MKYPRYESDDSARNARRQEGFSCDDLPVFEPLYPKEGAPHAFAPGSGEEAVGSPGFPLPPAPPSETRKRPRGPATDFASLRAQLPLDEKRYESRTFSDYLVAFLTPFMIFIMMASLVYFVLDVRFVYTEVMDRNLRWVAFHFLMGVVALNRLVARDGKDESVIYFLALAMAAALYTVGLQAYEVGSVAGGFLSGPWSVLFNVCVVAFLWWVTNRLTHECCVDSHPEAGDVGILTGTARRLRQAMARRPKSADQEDLLEPVDPSAWKKPEKKKPAEPLATTARLGKRHPGISIFFFSIPVMFVFAVGLRVIQHGGPAMILMGHVYVGCYTVAALTLLMLTSLGQLREYFRARRTTLPAGLAVFWVSLGLVMVALVSFGAAALPMPDLPPIAYVIEHQYDPWRRGSSFSLEPIAAAPLEIVQQTQFMLWVGRGVLTILGLFVAYGLLRAVGAVAFSIARRRDLYPAFVVRFFDRVDRLLIKLAGLPKWPSFPRRTRIDRAIATCARFTNPMGDPSRRARMTDADLIEYAYDALCALAYDLAVPRRPDQTPYEFIESFPRELSSLRDEAVELTQLYVLSNYAGYRFDERTLDRVRKFWLAYEKARRRVLR